MTDNRVTEAEIDAVTVAPRITRQMIEDEITSMHFTTAYDIAIMNDTVDDDTPIDKNLASFTVCLAVLKNGWTIIGKSAPASPENFDADLGRRLAGEDVVNQVWPLMAYELKSKLAKQLDADH